MGENVLSSPLLKGKVDPELKIEPWSQERAKAEWLFEFDSLFVKGG